MAKKLMSFRLPSDVLDLLKQAAKASKTSQAKALEGMVRKEVPEILRKAAGAAN